VEKCPLMASSSVRWGYPVRGRTRKCEGVYQYRFWTSSRVCAFVRRSHSSVVRRDFSSWFPQGHMEFSHLVPVEKTDVSVNRSECLSSTQLPRVIRAVVSSSSQCPRREVVCVRDSFVGGLSVRIKALNGKRQSSSILNSRHSGNKCLNTKIVHHVDAGQLCWSDINHSRSSAVRF